MRFKLFLEALAAETVPPAPGTRPLKPGNVRLYHYINPRGDQTEDSIGQTVRRDGINIGMAKGQSYGEPNCVGASTEIPHQGKIFAEFDMQLGDPRWQIGKPRSQKDVDWLNSSGANVTFSDSIRPDEIAAVHLPWHHTFRYLESNHMIPQVLAGEYDYLLDKPDSEEAKAIQYIKAHHGSRI